METREPVVDEQGNPNKPKIDGTPPLPLKGEGKLVLGRKTNLALCGDFWPVRGRGRGTTPGKFLTRPVGGV